MKSYEQGNAVVVSNISEKNIEAIRHEDKPLEKFKAKFSNRLFGVKGLKTLLPILLIGVCALIVLKGLPSSKNSSASTKADTDSVSYTSSLEYISILEEKLNDVLSGISGAGKTKVLISIDSSPILNIAQNEEIKTVATSGGSTTTTTTQPIYVTANGKSNPLVIGETLPEIKGVIVVSSGAKDVRVKMDIINAVRTALGISSDKIDVFIGG